MALIFFCKASMLESQPSFATETSKVRSVLTCRLTFSIAFSIEALLLAPAGGGVFLPLDMQTPYATSLHFNASMARALWPPRAAPGPRGG